MNPVVMDDIPYDLETSTIAALATMVSGSLHMIILFKSVEEEAQGTESVSAGLSSRVAIFAADKFAALSQLINKSTSGPFASWANNARGYCMASARKFVAIDQAKKGNVGLAIAFLKAALDTIGTSNSAGNLKSKFSKSKNSSDSMTSRLRASINDLLHEYSLENDRLSFQPIPKGDKLNESWPSGREVYPATGSWAPPPSLLNPSSAHQSASSRAYY
jgi:hypothetical protein